MTSKRGHASKKRVTFTPVEEPEEKVELSEGEEESDDPQG